ncbi:hypothetical protein MGMO_37c00200 [Methyloglobulus morosus KoM1]|uniref:Uncharacterized protein n=1 Tax=Methyloglobulus morosus KoM1 TaxID=1116472 RepID=V5BZ28_9GAMM|nr:hypothetical protein MGMO_37c00200 [Methyloglobulus morosus KoM1]
MMLHVFKRCRRDLGCMGNFCATSHILVRLIPVTLHCLLWVIESAGEAMDSSSANPLGMRVTCGGWADSWTYGGIGVSY